MGCDIHMRYQKVSDYYKRDKKLSELLSTSNELEIDWMYIDDGPRDQTYNMQFSIQNRNYYWFGRMSGVRGSDGPVLGTIGYPYQVDVGDDEYMHSHSHIYLDTLINEEWTELDQQRMDVFINQDIPRMKEYCDNRNLLYSEFRILMGYDS